MQDLQIHCRCVQCAEVAAAPPMIGPFLFTNQSIYAMSYTGDAYAVLHQSSDRLAQRHCCHYGLQTVSVLNASAPHGYGLYSSFSNGRSKAHQVL